MGHNLLATYHFSFLMWVKICCSWQCISCHDPCTWHTIALLWIFLRDISKWLSKALVHFHVIDLSFACVLPSFRFKCYSIYCLIVNDIPKAFWHSLFVLHVLLLVVATVPAQFDPHNGSLVYQLRKGSSGGYLPSGFCVFLCKRFKQFVWRNRLQELGINYCVYCTYSRGV